MKLITVRTEPLREKHKSKVSNRFIRKHYGVVYDKRIWGDISNLTHIYRQKIRFVIKCDEKKKYVVALIIFS